MDVFSINEYNKKTNPFDISITIGIPDQSPDIHAGIIFKDNSKTKFLHLAWDLDLRLEEDMDNYSKFKWVQFKYFFKGDIEDVRKRSAIRFFEMVFRKNGKKIPYGTFYKYSKISRDGEFILGKGEFGLTCATFIIAIFEAIGIFLVDKSTWKYSSEDDVWRENLIKLIEEKLHQYKHMLRIFELEKGRPRFKPEQIVGASMSKKIPTNYKYCKKKGKKISKFILA